MLFLNCRIFWVIILNLSVFLNKFLFLNATFQVSTNVLDMDARVGYVLGHHSVTKEFYAIHRNQKSYLHFHNNLQKWLSLTNQQFKEISINFTSKTRKSLEGDEEQTYTFGANQWMGKYNEN